jgi:arginase
MGDRPPSPQLTMLPALIGLPYDASSSFMPGAAEAPPIVREALRSTAGNPWAERMVKSVTPDRLADLGDLTLPSTPEARELIERAIADVAAQQRPFIALGGDHSVTYPILRGLRTVPRPLTLLQIDAHPDLYDQYEGDRYSHACPFARIMEEGLVDRLIQVGIRAMTAHGRDQARRFHVEQIDMRSWADGARPWTTGRVYVSIDLDGLDPAFAPGVAHREPGGLTVREVLTILDTLGGEVVGADIVEFNPRRDVGGITAEVAAKLVKELAAQFVLESD